VRLHINFQSKAIHRKERKEKEQKKKKRVQKRLDSNRAREVVENGQNFAGVLGVQEKGKTEGGA